jgi:hypothetical protein
VTLGWRLCVLYLGLSIWFCAPLFEQPLAFGHEDWDQHLFYRAQVLTNLIAYDQAPFWSPWYCGGNVMWANPQVPLLALEYPLTLVMPLQLAAKITVVLHYWLGLLSTHLLLTRGLQLTSPHLAVWLSVIFVTCGALASHVAVGHTVFLPVLYLPLALLCIVLALRERALRYAFLAGGILAVMLWNGGLHVLPMAATAIGALAVVATLVMRSRRPLLITVVAFAFCASVSAPRLVPAILFVTGDRIDDMRDIHRPDTVPLSLLDDIYLDPAPDLDRLELNWDPHEYVNFIGPIAAFLLAAGVIGVAVRRRSGDWWLGAGLATATLFAFALSLGEFAPWSPAALYADLPMLSGFRIPARYTIVATLLAVATAAWTFGHIGLRIREQHLESVALTLCLAASAHVVLVNQQLFRDAFGVAPFDVAFDAATRPAGITFDAVSQANPGRQGSPMLEALTEGRSILQCFEPLQLRPTIDPARSLVFADAGTPLRITRVSPNRIEFRVLTGDSPARVFLNTNWSPGWRSDAGDIRRMPGGPGFVSIPAGQAGAYAFWFEPPGLWPGLLTMVAGFVCAGWCWRLKV